MEHSGVAAVMQNPIHIRSYENHWLKVRQTPELAHGSQGRGSRSIPPLPPWNSAAPRRGRSAQGIFLSACLATGRLVNALPQQFPDDFSYFVITPERPQRMRREAQRFRDWLVAAASSPNEL